MTYAKNTFVYQACVAADSLFSYTSCKRIIYIALLALDLTTLIREFTFAYSIPIRDYI